MPYLEDPDDQVIEANEVSLVLRPAHRAAFAGRPAQASGAADNDAMDEDARLVNQGPPTRVFLQTRTSPKAPLVRDLLRLELYQAYPHETFSTLCVKDFTMLAESWYYRRSVQAHVRGEDGARAPPAVYDASVDMSMRRLQDSVHGAVERLAGLRRAVVTSTGRAPGCGLAPPTGAVLQCAVCAVFALCAVPPPPLDDADLQGLRVTATAAAAAVQRGLAWRSHGELRGSELLLSHPYGRYLGAGFVMGCGHGNPLIRTRGLAPPGREQERFLECRRCGRTEPMERNPRAGIRQRARQAGGSGAEGDSSAAYLSVAGLHFIVDVCDSKTFVKFQSTRLSSLHERHAVARGREDIICQERCDEPDAFDAIACFMDQDGCACRPA